MSLAGLGKTPPAAEDVLGGVVSSGLCAAVRIPLLFTGDVMLVHFVCSHPLRRLCRFVLVVGSGHFGGGLCRRMWALRWRNPSFRARSSLLCRQRLQVFSHAADRAIFSDEVAAWSCATIRIRSSGRRREGGSSPYFLKGACQHYVINLRIAQALAWEFWRSNWQGIRFMTSRRIRYHPSR